MRLLLSTALLALLTSSAQADIRVLAPVLSTIPRSRIWLATSPNRRHQGGGGRAGMNVIVGQIKTATPVADVVALPADLMNTLYLDGGIVGGSYTPLGRDELALAVKKGAAKPDISTVEKLAAVLKSAGAVESTIPRAAPCRP